MDRSEICCSTHGDGKPDVPCLHSPTGLIRDRYRRLDEVHMVADSSIGQVVRLDVDDPLSKAARDFTRRIYQVGRTDAQVDAEMERLQWFEQYQAARLAQQNAERPSADLEAAAKAAERRINEQWRPKP
jgi:hypothetical protein